MFTLTHIQKNIFFKNKTTFLFKKAKQKQNYNNYNNYNNKQNKASHQGMLALSHPLRETHQYTSWGRSSSEQLQSAKKRGCRQPSAGRLS
jgi:hypothetical protein